MNGIEAMLGRLTVQQQAQVEVFYRALLDGTLTSAEFTNLVTTRVLAGNAHGYRVGALVARAKIEAQTGAVELTPPVTGARHLDEGRIRDALSTVLAAEQDTAMQLSRLAANEPLDAATDGSHDLISRSSRTTGWVRSINADACELCHWLRKDGYIYPSTSRMHKHTGCMCEQSPIVRNTTKEKAA